MRKLQTMLLAATALSALTVVANAGDIEFAPVDAPKEDAAKRLVNVSPTVTIDGNAIETRYHVIARSGDRIGDAEFGVLTDASGAPLRDGDGKPVVSDDADFTSFLPVGGKLFSLTHFESRPAAMYLSELKQDSDGNLTPVSSRPVDFTSVGGLWVPCAGSVTPWNTHLGSEEYPPDARSVEEATSLDDIDSYYQPMVRYQGVNDKLMTLDVFKSVFKPYKYGFPVEVAVSEDGSTSVAKHYAMGRVAVELAYIMPDNRIAYITDDGTNTGLFRFVADKAGDLSSVSFSPPSGTRLRARAQALPISSGSASTMPPTAKSVRRWRWMSVSPTSSKPRPTTTTARARKDSCRPTPKHGPNASR